jgi:4-amino-4-deoxy-L-arabinose transferase-like glycosyltransferase
MNHARFALAVIVLGYLLVGALYAVKTPDWQVPDEPAHYSYIRQLAEERRFPVLEMGDYDQSYISRLTTERFPPELSLEAVEYEDWQPPLYYFLAAPVYLIFDGALTPLRLFSVLIGAGVVLLAYAVAATVFPEQPLIAPGTAAFVAFLPQHVAMMAGVNNDGLTEVLIGVALWMVLRWMRVAEGRKTKGERTSESRWLVGLGIVLGLGLVTKASFLPLVLVVAVTIWITWWRDGDRAWGKLFRTLAPVFGPALLIVAPWWLHNVVTYGGLDVYGTVNHDAVVFEQPRTGDWIRDHGLGAWLERGVTFTFQSFWGQFGWMGVLMPTWLYRALALWSGVLVAGFLYWLRGASGRWQGTGGRRSPITDRRPLVILAVTAFLVALVYLYYNRTFVQHQGRYLFPALVPIALGVALAVDALLRLMRWPDRLRPLAFAVPYLAMVALDLYALWRFIIPALT